MTSDAPEWRPWGGGNWWGPGAGAHLYVLHANAVHDIKAKAEKAWHNNPDRSGYQVVHFHPAEANCNPACIYYHNTPVDPPPKPPEKKADAPERMLAKVQVLQHGAKTPVRVYGGDAGFDLAYSGPGNLVIPAGAYADIPCGVAVQWPEGVWALVIGRSSSFRNRGLLVQTTVIDNGWRGELWAMCRNVSDRPATIKPGERVAQVVPLPLLAMGIDLEVVDKLDPSDRGTNGVGSSGL